MCVSPYLCMCACVCWLINTHPCLNPHRLVLTDSRGNQHSQSALNHTQQRFSSISSHTHTHQSISHRSPMQPSLPTLSVSCAQPQQGSSGANVCVFTSLLLQSEWNAARNNLKDYLQKREGRTQQNEKQRIYMSSKVSVGLLSFPFLQMSFISVLINYCELGGKIKWTRKTKRCMLMCGGNLFLTVILCVHLGPRSKKNIVLYIPLTCCVSFFASLKNH